jgi:predicted acylesterase/phospholipase RssA
MKPSESLESLEQEIATPDAQMENGHDASQQPGVNGSRAAHRPRWRTYTAFVLSGGGARGALQVGALRALLEAGERPDVVVGTSIGAWNGALLARDPTPAGVERLAEVWLTAHPTRVLLGLEQNGHSPAMAIASSRYATYIAAAQRLAAGHPSLYGDAGLRHFAQAAVGETTFEELTVPLRVIAADITHGRRVVFSAGPIAPTILASSAIPGIFPPVRIGDTVYVDGGILDNASIETALALGARRLFILDVGYDEGGAGSALWLPEPEEIKEIKSNGKPARSSRGSRSGVHPLAAVLERSSQVMSRYHFDRAIARIPRGIETHVLRIGNGAGGGALEFEKAPEWITAGYESARAQLARSPVAAQSAAAVASAGGEAAE